MVKDIFLKRIYDGFDQVDGYRVLVDRLWPRGISKNEARLNEWAKDIAPSSDLRKWFRHQPDRFNEFKKEYINELRTGNRQKRKMQELIEIAQSKRVTLIYAAKDPIYNHAIILKEELKNGADH